MNNLNQVVTHYMNINLYKIIGFLFVMATAITTEPATAAIYTCEVDGKKVFQGTPCADKNALEQSGRIRAFGNKNIHSSWFSKPKNLTTNFSCDEKSCTCRFDNNSDRVVRHLFFTGNKRLLLPMRTFKENWELYYSRQQPDSRERTTPSFGQKRAELRQFSACQIAYRQHAVQKFYSSVSNDIKQSYARLSAEQEKIYTKCGGTPEQNLKGIRAEKWLNCTSSNKPSLTKLQKDIRQAKRDLDDLESLTRMMNKPVKDVVSIR